MNWPASPRNSNSRPSSLCEADALDLAQNTIVRVYEDSADSDIASVLGCSVKAVENKLYRARQSLREKLARCL